MVYNVVMVYTCCIPGCKTGYKSCKSEEKVALFGFPSNEELKQKWISAIPRKNWTIKKNHKVCIKHFSNDDIEEYSNDHHDKRRADRESQTLKRLRLNSTAVPRIFPNLPKYLSTNKPPDRSTASSSAARQSKQNVLFQQNAEKMFLKDQIDDISMLKDKINDVILPDGYVFIAKESYCWFYFILADENLNVAPQLLVSVHVSNLLKLTAFVSSIS